MKITTFVKQETNVTTFSLHMKVRDSVDGSITNEEGKEICQFTDEYVPSFFPGQHYGDYLILDIDIETGHIKNWKKPTPEQLKEFIDRIQEGVVDE